MTYALKRTRDGAGDSGPMSMAIIPSPDGNHQYKHAARPEVGAVMRVGSPYARSYSAQDYWQTTPISEILEEWEEAVNDYVIEYVRFKTGNSEYIWSKS